jgi:hypothetical protein
MIRIYKLISTLSDAVKKAGPYKGRVIQRTAGERLKDME